MKNICECVQHREHTLACQKFTLQFPDLWPPFVQHGPLYPISKNTSNSMPIWTENVLVLMTGQDEKYF